MHLSRLGEAPLPADISHFAEKKYLNLSTVAFEFYELDLFRVLINMFVLVTFFVKYLISHVNGGKKRSILDHQSLMLNKPGSEVRNYRK